MNKTIATAFIATGSLLLLCASGCKNKTAPATPAANPPAAATGTTPPTASAPTTTTVTGGEAAQTEAIKNDTTLSDAQKQEAIGRMRAQPGATGK
jgi:hypothetical protein